MKQKALLITVCAAALLSAGCSTSRRIREYNALYNTYPSDARKEIRKGKVEIGFTSDMVLMALGKPDRKYFRKTDAGEVLVWAYSRRETRSEKQKVTGTFRFRDKDRRFQTATDTVVVDVDRYIEYDHMRVELKDDRVVAVETAKSSPIFF